MTLWDFVLATLPIVFLWDIRISPKIKAGICGLMGLGVLTGICAVMRTVLLNVQASADPTWDVIPLAIWFSLEGNIAMIAATIPTIQPLFRSAARPKRSGYIPQADSSRKIPSKRSNDPYALPETLTSSSDSGAGETYDLESQGVPQRDGIRKSTKITVISDARARVL
ncbi:hypothetical protein MMC30_002859 [Trapelia coarctata]|nr:hypothetical protein [Trapelia coarctata]